ncbi:MAG: PIN domain-containing protein [Cryomorphaceae bacterium]
MQYLLDTNICVFFLRGNLRLDETIRAKGVDNCFISEISIFELKFGAENSEDPKKSHKAVDKFVKGLNVVPIFGTVEQYAKTKVDLRKNGTPMHDEFDLIIGVTALTNELTLVTDNTKDFRHIKSLKLENWVERN